MTVDEMATLALHDQARFKRTVLHPLIDACKTTKGRTGHFAFDLLNSDQVAVWMRGAEWSVSRDYVGDGGYRRHGSLVYYKDYRDPGRYDYDTTDAPWVLAGLQEVCEDPHTALQRAQMRWQGEQQAYAAASAQERTERRRAEESARQAKMQALATQHAATLARITAAVADLCHQLAPGVTPLALNVPLAAAAICRIEHHETWESIVIAKQVFFGNQYRDQVAFLHRKGTTWTALHAKIEWTTVADLLEATAADPFAVAKHIQCCVFCARELTDDMSRTMGYGPDCARTWKRPWGQTSRGVAPSQ